MRQAAPMGILTTCAVTIALSTVVYGADDTGLKPKDDGYRGIWFALGQFSDRPYGRGSWKGYWDYGDKNTGGNGTYTAKHVPIAVYAPEVKKTFFCYGGFHMTCKMSSRLLRQLVSPVRE